MDRTTEHRSNLYEEAHSAWLIRWSMGISAFLLGLIIAGDVANVAWPVPNFDNRIKGACYWTSAMVPVHVCDGFWGASLVGFIRDLPIAAYLFVAIAFWIPPLTFAVFLLPAIVIVGASFLFSKVTVLFLRR